ncbi:MAG TPA: glycogen synthase GlgA [Chitinispirillaceae bacterium]|jgi:starch synthase|nr:glycogen synthase GlgA [Chitinispirillaceae bacterium]
MRPILNTEKKLNILIVSSEMYPFAQIGGLADVVASLSAQLKKSGHDVRVVIPRYSLIDPDKYSAKIRLESMGVWMGNKEEWCSVMQTTSPSGVPVYMIEHRLFFDRYGLYHDSSMHDYDDNPVRFGFLSRAALQLCKDISFKPDIVHANDWQTALAPVYLKLWHWNDPLFKETASVITLHNVAYQGIYPKSHIDYLGLGWHNFTEDKFESYGKINFLKGGIYFSDVITAVSPTFARDLVTPSGGFGLAPYISRRQSDLIGILNGIDYQIWDPETDPLIPEHFSKTRLDGKKTCKKALQKAFDLKQDENTAVIGAIGRFVEQKGFHLIARAIEGVLQNMKVQFVILASGEKSLEHFFGMLPVHYPGRAGSFIGFDNARSHLIEAGCDFFLMPSLFEPCGLNQMYSQRYGTLPIVRATGGLNDTVENYDEQTGEGTGFKFNDPTPEALYNTIGWAVSTYYDRPGHIKKMIGKAMVQDFSWKKSAREYINAYHRALRIKRTSNSQNRSYYW